MPCRFVMKLRFNSVRAAFGIVLAVGACSAQAFSIDLQSNGPFVNAASPFFSTTETVTLEVTNPAGMPALTSTYFEIPVATAFPEPIDGFYTNGTDSFNYTADLLTTTSFGNTESGTGTWTYSSGAGAYGGLTGGGVFSILVDSGTNNSAYLAFGGDLEPAPEPAPIIPVALGVLGLALRKRLT